MQKKKNLNKLKLLETVVLLWINKFTKNTYISIVLIRKRNLNSIAVFYSVMNGIEKNLN